MGIADNDPDPAFRYESLAREAFDNCGKWGDPWGYAAQDFYGEFMDEPTTLRGKRALGTILSQLVWKYRATDIADKLKEIEDSIYEATTQEDVIDIIDNTIETLRSID